MKYNKLLAAVCTVAMALTVQNVAAQSTNAAGNHTGNDQINPGASIRIEGSRTKWEYFRVDRGAPRGRNDPRGERGVASNNSGASISGSNTHDRKKIIVLKGTCDINACKNTTILQVFNTDSGSSNRNKPYWRMVAKEKNSAGRWVLAIEGRGYPRQTLATVKDKPYSFELRTDNRKVRIIIRQDGRTVVNKLVDIPRVGITDEGGRVRRGKTGFRFGAYHHGFRNARAAIRYRNTKGSTYRASSSRRI